MDIFAEVRKLGFSDSEYVVVGSGIMQAMGIKNVDDIDIVVTPELFERCTAQGWEWHPRPNGEPGLRRGDVSLYLDVNCPPAELSFAQLLAGSVVVEGVRFSSLDQLVDFKKAYGRDKDMRDLELIAAYFASHKR